MRNSRRKGFTLVEVMATFPIFLIASGLAVNVIYGTMKLSAASAQAATNDSRVDSSLFQLRRDVWGASTLTADDKSVTTTLGEKKITWKVADDGSVTRNDGVGQQVWSDIATNWKFSAAPYGVIITTSTQQLPLANQIMLAGRTTP